MEEITLEWFFKVPGLFITVGVVLIIIAIIVFIIGNAKAKKESDVIENTTDLPKEEDVSVTPTPDSNNTININGIENKAVLGTLGGTPVRNMNTVVEPVNNNVVNPLPVTPTVQNDAVGESIMPNVETGSTVITPVDLTVNQSQPSVNVGTNVVDNNVLNTPKPTVVEPVVETVQPVQPPIGMVQTPPPVNPPVQSVNQGVATEAIKSTSDVEEIL